MSGILWHFLFDYRAKYSGRVGHVRVFGAMSAIASAAILMHVAFNQMFMDATLASGFGLLALYCESWLNDKATNDTRHHISYDYQY